MRVYLNKKDYISISPEAFKKPKDEFVKEMLSYYEGSFGSREEAKKAFTDIWMEANPGRGGKLKEVDKKGDVE